MLFAAFLSSAFIASVLGFLTGATAENQVAAIALAKLSFMPVMLFFGGDSDKIHRMELDCKLLWTHYSYFCSLLSYIKKKKHKRLAGL